MLPPQPPPSSAAGVVLWLRTNLFSGPLNIALTVLGLAIIWMMFRTLWPWLSHSVWNAGSMAECRQIISEAYGPDAHGGCFAIIKHRWNQFIFGFYPQDLYWRPVLAFGLLFLALAPVLFADSAKARRIVLGLAVGLTLIISATLGGGAGLSRLRLRSLDVFRRETLGSDGVRLVVLVRVLHTGPERDASFLGGSRPSNSVVLGEGRSGNDSTLGSVSSVGCDDSSVECSECESFVGHN